MPPQSPSSNSSPNPSRIEFLCELISQEFESALAELTRRGIDTNFDTEALREYRDLHPRQDS